ncbi:TetR/AcrR family transcriptional regulator [Salisediminibacterium halotolerans]|uniref:DNA-binding transcriptional regulator, AcrR family n=1 Tax=Salisediminibacterium halotolerans TaxID=517425 RepID=A0A1H9V1Z4_9BACI|nr:MULTISPECIES: TetR/AcrR family transcriptional regulator [Salisediminibacterium]RLJ71713.1 TetR family transcriptional regulator [Actinophytocola xinjiangensis]RPE86863.1 TetR family transcriptional regulator [Salisediminibacterium halotolerans]TWG32926.1 TetR family transcriptional regulator [Salisediminibacterium halotolerans]SES15267.1 DNA-binding transcriptional regulator, AcrR family [Salisediminibacterium haloalkalitolerans]GEL07780.1 TetR family transcriptional regulator [Salisedimin
MSIKREKILRTADRLFYEHGFRGVGLKQIIKEADVATMTLYNHFDSKDKLVEEVLLTREERYWSYLDHDVEEGGESPFIAAVAAHGRFLKQESYKGCMFLRAIQDYANTDNQIEQIARQHKTKLLTYFQQLAERKGKTQQKEIAYQMTLLLEGATSMTELIGAEAATAHSITMARMMIRESS